jgi:prepilin-type N-terminal cleavage/methylation domain-containing protein
MTTRHQRSGLTLLELLTVMTILAILIALVIGLGRYADVLARRHQAVAELGQWQEALHQYYLRLGEYPTNPVSGSTSNEASSLLSVRVPINGDTTNPVQVVFGAQTTCANQLAVRDPWGMPYFYQAPTNDHPQVYELFSSGPDRQKDTSDDMRFHP